MRSTLRTLLVGSALGFGLLAVGAQEVRACGCGGRGGGHGRAWGGHTFHAGHGGHGGGCGMMAGAGSMPVAGMSSMPGMNPGGYHTYPTDYPQPVNTGYYPQNTGRYPAAAAQYYCPMHPGVVSTSPGTCPHCHMALTRRP